MAQASTFPKLREGFEEHLRQTEGHVQRLEQIFTSLGEKAKGETCQGMKGLVKEGEEMIDKDFEGAIKDAGIIGAAQRVEHYEIAAYGSARELAQLLGHPEHVTLLEQTLEEEKETDKKLTTLAMDVNRQALGTSQQARAASA